MWDLIVSSLSYGMATYSFWHFLDLIYDMFMDIKKEKKN